jgi:DNA topoisomerase-1
MTQRLRAVAGSDAGAGSGAAPAPAPAGGRRDAVASGLRYVSPDSPGIRRRRAGRGFRYEDAAGRPIRDARQLERIRALAIPPAWTEVWICPRDDGHLQAIGRDARGRRQYRYHAAFRARRDDGKFARLVRFGERLPRIRRRARRDLRSPGLPRDKVLATVVSLLEATRLRVGNAEYARLNRSFGVSTLRNRHATVTATTLSFRFRGKGGRTEERRLVDRRLAAVVRRCQELPGQELFQYVDEAGEVRGISSEDVNAYLRDAAGSEEVSAKDFRTWSATLLAFRALRDGAGEADGAEEQAPTGGSRRRPAGQRGTGKRVNRIMDALRIAAEEMGDTVTVTRNSYVHPGVLAAFEPAEPAAGSRAGTVRPADGGATAAPEKPVTATGRPRAANAEPDRRDELELLALLRTWNRRRKRSQGRPPTSTRRAARPRGAQRATGAARRSQVGKARVADRSTRCSA